MSRVSNWCGVLLFTVIAWGCGKNETPKTTATNSDSAPSADTEAEGTAEDSKIIPTAAIDAPPVQPLKKLDGLEFEEDVEMTEEDDIEVLDDPQPGTPEFLLRDVAKLRFEPLAETDDKEKLKQLRKQRNEKIISQAGQVITQTRKDPEKSRIFEVAVHYMQEARLELALQGDRENIDALYEDAAFLWERDPKSKLAGDAAYTLVNLAYQNARRSTSTENKWLQEFTRQAVQFAKNFPQDERRALPMLHTAARSCELFGMNKLATQAYLQLQQSFPQSKQSAKAKGVIRRLQLVGQSVKLGGPTIDGGYLSMDDVSGRPVLIVFWETTAKPFIAELPALKEFQKAYAKQGFTLVGVCLDDDQAAVEKFIKTHKIDNWPHIFYTEAGKTGWNNPIAVHYGIQEVGNWLVDSTGVVASTNAKVQNLEEQLSPLLKRGISRLPSNPQR